MIWLLACTGGEPRPSLVLISVDTLRADFVYDHPWVQTPELDALMATSVVFERAYTAAPTTLASHTSLFSGRHPHTHGVPYNGVIVPEEEVLLAERLSGAGYHTGAVVGGFPLEERFGLDQGFDDYAGPWRNAEAVTNVALAWHGLHEDESFLFVHYWDVHHPWTPPEPWDHMYREDSLELRPKKEVGPYRAKVSHRAEGWEELNRALQGSYGGAVSYVDHHIGRLLEGLNPDTIVVVVSDHGEVHHENKDAWSHGVDVHDTETRIPLVMHVPGWEPARRTELVSNIDVTPTLLEILGLSAEGMEGQSLARAHERAVYSEATMPHRPRTDGSWANEGNCRAMWEGTWKAVQCPFYRQPPELFAMPDEDEPVAAEVDQAMQDALTRWAKTTPAVMGQMATDEDTLGQLEALGYLLR